MGSETKIEWTDHTFNPWRGCARVSPGCQHCYAEALAKRTGIHGTWGPEGERVISSDAYWRHPLQWDRAAAAAGVRRRVFCASMADVFEDRPDLVEPRARLAYLIGRTPNLDWLLLTKRPENIARLWITDVVPPNVWLGTTAEDQERADHRILQILAAPAALRFLSLEPLLGPVDLEGSGNPWWLGGHRDGFDERGRRLAPTGPRIDWVIVGGESGPGARPCEVAWIRDVVRQCREAGVPVFVKQLGANVRDRNDAGFDGSDERAWPVELEEAGRIDSDPEREGDVYQGAPVRVRLFDPKGGNPAEWPEILRIREFPTVGGAS